MSVGTKHPQTIAQRLLSNRRPAWETWALVVLLSASAVMYVWGANRNGWANAYYSAAVQAGQHDLKAFLFGAADWGNSITVDKPPLSLWVMGLSARIFGLSPWALLLPQAMMTLASTLLIYRIMRSSFPAAAGLLSAAVFATTPITVLLARYNNPDPLMVLLMVSALYAGVRGATLGRTWLFNLAASLLALGFLAKQLQAFLVLPAIAVLVLLYTPDGWRKRLRAFTFAGGTLALGALAWPMFVDLTPSDSRPYIGGSTSNSMLELTLGYNGLDRVMQQDEAPSTALIPEAFRRVHTDAGLFRLFNANYGQEIGWLLLPALVAAIVIMARLIRRQYCPAQSIVAAASVTWFVTTYLVLSFMGNSFHSYYTASLAAPMALCIGLGLSILTTSRPTVLSRLIIAFALIASFTFSRGMWQLSTEYPEWLGTALFFLGLLATSMISVPAPREWIPRLANGLIVGALLIGPVACSLITMASPQEGSNPLSGGLSRSPDTLSRFLYDVKLRNPSWAAGVALGVEPTPTLAGVLRNTSEQCTWAAATYPGQTAARFQLEVGRPVMALGGFAGVDPNPTLEQFQDWVKSQRVCYLVEQPDHLAVPGNSAELMSIQDWVADNFRAEKIDDITVYRLTS